MIGTFAAWHLLTTPEAQVIVVANSKEQAEIIDRYARQGVLPIIYFDNIAKYVKDGGAVLVAHQGHQRRRPRGSDG